MKKILIGLIALIVCSLVVFGSGAIGFDNDILSTPKVITITTADGTVVTIPIGETTEDEGFGGTIYNREISFDAGIAVDGTTVIDGSGNIDAPITSSTGTFSSTLGVTGNFAVNTDKFTVAASTGNTVVAGTLGVTGVATLTTNLIVDTNTLFVNASTNRVGVGTTTPSASFVVGEDKFTVAGATGNTAVVGTLGVTGASTIAGLTATTGSFTSTLGVTGITTLSDIVKIDDANATLKIGTYYSATSLGNGCIMMGDSSNATTSPVYITATGTTVNATTTKPGICQ